MQQIPLVMVGDTVHLDTREWLDQLRAERRNRLLNKLASVVKTHVEPRRRFFDHHRHEHFDGATLIGSLKGVVSVRDDGLGRRPGDAS